MSRTEPPYPEPPSATTVLACAVGQVIVAGLWLLLVLEQQALANTFLSTQTWAAFMELTGGSVRQTPQGIEAIASLGGIGLIAFGGFVFANLCTALRLHRVKQESLSQQFQSAIYRNTFSLLPITVWTGLWILSFVVGGDLLSTILMLTLDVAVAVSLAMWMLTLFRSSKVADDDQSSICWWWMIGGMVFSTLVFTAMNWGLWYSLRLPHGDSAMYEEHLWNLLHGKGFRSYLDQGLFLGEHIQVIHVALTPFYMLWPSHLLLELCESAALASGAIPVFLIAKRHSDNSRAAMWMAFAYLLYFAVHYLDISIDLKTFRPISFGVPLMLWAIDAMERKRWVWLSLFAVLSLAAKEDFAIVLAPLGLWLFMTSFLDRRKETDSPVSSTALWVGGILCVLATAYLLFVVKVAIPWFRNWETVHYARYFSEFGETPTEIVMNMVTNPGLLISQFVTAGSFVLFLHLLMPMGFPLRAWSRLLVGLPLFLLLCLNELAQQTPGPVHHFHAPLIPIIVWATCANLSVKSDLKTPERSAKWVLCCALASCVIFSFGPLSLRFWDSGRAGYWARRYVPDERAEQFQKIENLIPRSMRVASTDYVHPRFTHHERSYDYSDYLRKVSDYLPKVPDDTDVIVIDTRHPYSAVRSLEDVRELRESPDDWEILPDQTDGYFIVLMRKGINFDGLQSFSSPQTE